MGAVTSSPDDSSEDDNDDDDDDDDDEALAEAVEDDADAPENMLLLPSDTDSLSPTSDGSTETSCHLLPLPSCSKVLCTSRRVTPTGKR